MIEEISIRHLGVIGEARLPLGPGFTALTGETGAGKTMVVTALGLLLGDRADTGAIRSGSGQALVEGHWSIDERGAVADRVRDAGGDLDEGALILSRSISQEGRSRAVVGGRSTPVGVLNEIGQQLVVVHGQSDQVRLKSSTAQREALDRFAGPELAHVLGDYQEVFRRWMDAQSELDKEAGGEREAEGRCAGEEALDVLVADRDRRAREAEDLRAAMTEIEEAAPRRGEDDELTARAERLTNVEDLRLAAAQAHELISSESLDEARDAVALLETARRTIDRVSGHDPALEPIAESIANAGFVVGELATQLASYLASLDTDGGRELETVQERRAELANLMRKYGPSLDEVIDYLDSGSSRLLELDQDSDRIDALRLEVDADRARVSELADRLSDLRRTAGIRLSERVTGELAALAMSGARITVDVTTREEYPLSGGDSAAAASRSRTATARARCLRGRAVARHARARGRHRRDRPRADVHLRRGRRGRRRLECDRDRAAPRTPRAELAGHRRHPSRASVGLRDQPPAGRQRQRGHRHGVERAAARRRGARRRDGTPAERTAGQ